MSVEGRRLRIAWTAFTAIVVPLLLTAATASAESRAAPRQAVLSYLEACRTGDYAEAADYLNLSALAPAERQAAGARLARRLKVVLDQELWVDLEALSEEPEGDADDGLPTGIDRVGTIETPAGPVEILIERVGAPPGEWKFSRATVAQVPAMYEEFGYGPLRAWLPAPFFTIRFLELELWQWVGLLLLVVGAWALGTGTSLAVISVVRRVARRTKTELDDHLVRAASSPLVTILAVILFYAGSFLLGLSVPAQRFLGGLSKGLLVVGFTWLALRTVDVIAAGFEERAVARADTAAHTVIQMGGRIAKVFLLIIAVLSALQNVGFNITGLVAGLGVGGIAVALAAQKTFENFFGGMSLLVDRPVQVGNFCRFGDKIGTVEEIGLRSTRVRTLDRTLVTVPNSEFSSIQLENFAVRDRIRFYTTLGLRYETTADQLRFTLVKLRELLLAHPKVDLDPARVRFVGYGAYSLDLEIFAYVGTPDWNEFLAIREDLLLRIMDVVEESGSGFAFPSQTLYVGHDDGLHDERSRNAEGQVREWRGRNELPLPDFAAERIEQIHDTLPYPAEGSTQRSG
jgi:MscS family membrane protein